MIRLRLLPWFLLACLVPCELRARETVEGPQTARPEALVADHEALRDIVRQQGIQTAAEPPGFTQYVRDFGFTVIEWLSDRFGGWVERLGITVARLVGVAAQAVFVVALVLLVVLLARALYTSVRRRQALATLESPVAPREQAAGDEDPGRSRDAWAEEIRRCLAAGDVAAACRALWWWLARTLVAGPLESSWTSRELVARAGRRDLIPGVRRLERMIYGASAPSRDDVRRLWSDLEEAVG